MRPHLFLRSTEGKVAAAVGIALLTVVALCFAFYLVSREIRRAHNQVANVDEVLVILGVTLARVTEAETGQRGYLLTGNDKFLEPYYSATRVLTADLDRLRELTRDNPVQQKALDELKVLVEERLARVKAVIEIRQKEGFSAALEFMQGPKGSELMAKIRRVIDQIGDEQRRVLNLRYSKTQHYSFVTLSVFSAIAVGNFILLVSIYLVVRNDLARRKATQERQERLLKDLAAANRDLQDFAHVVSHDLKAPLRSIANLVFFIESDYSEKMGTDAREHFRLLTSRVNRLHNLIEGILNYTKVARQYEDKTEVDTHQLVQGTIDMILPPANVQITIDKRLPIVRSEPTRLQQVFLNLISNAVKFLDKPEGRIVIGCTETPNSWTFRVTDNGPGIDPAHHDKIFQIFQTLKARDEEENTGIGLTIVKKIVEQWSGRVWLQSKAGEGTTFFFSIPKKQN